MLELTKMFAECRYTHVYRESNTFADIASKNALRGPVNTPLIQWFPTVSDS